MKRLPNWSDHPGFDKNAKLEAPSGDPGIEFVNWLADLQRLHDRPLRVLDVGAGLGRLVAWLCANGYDAYGVEPNLRYVDNSRSYFEGEGLGERLRGFSPDGGYPFESNSFDVVLSHHTLEHVEDIEMFAREVSRVTRPGGRGLHVFPAKWQPMEGHMLMPIAHWFPKGPARRMWIKLALRSGWAATYFTDLELDDRTDVFQRFSEDETFYRTVRTISRVLDRHGMDTDRMSSWTTRLNATRKLNTLRNPAIRNIAARSIAFIFTVFREPAITTTKR